MDDLFVLLGVGVALIIGLIAENIFKKTKIPDVPFLLIFGALLSFLGLTEGLKKSNATINLLLTFSLIYVIFYGSWPIRIKEVFKTAPWVLVMSFLNFIFVSLFVCLISLIFHFPLELAIAIGLFLSTIDGTIINHLLANLKISKRAEAFIQMESAITDILVIIVTLSIVSFSSVTLSTLLQKLTSFVLISTALGFSIGILWSFVLRKLSSLSHVPITTMAVLVVLFFLAEYLNSNGAIAVMVFAIVLGNMDLLKTFLHENYAEKIGLLDKEQKFFFENLTFLMRTLLLVYIGALMDFMKISYIFLGLLLVSFALIIRSFIYKFVKLKDMSTKEIHIMEVLSSKGITPIVLIPFLNTSSKFTNTILGAIFFSVIISSFMFYLIEKRNFKPLSYYILLTPKMIKALFKKKDITSFQETEVIHHDNTKRKN